MSVSYTHLDVYKRQGWFRPFGYEITRTTAADSAGNRLGHRFHYVLADLHEDFEKLTPSEFGFDGAFYQRKERFAQEMFGDILPVRRTMNGLYAVPTQDVVHLMGMENMCFALADYPEEFREMMDRLAEDYLAYFHILEKEGCLLPTAGSVSYTHLDVYKRQSWEAKQLGRRRKRRRGIEAYEYSMEVSVYETIGQAGSVLDDARHRCV